jgi:hypothetical protein
MCSNSGEILWAFFNISVPKGMSEVKIIKDKIVCFREYFSTSMDWKHIMSKMMTENNINSWKDFLTFEND